MFAGILLLASLAFQANAAIKPVSVGRDGLTFDPASTTAAIGDIIEFRFWARNHSVVAGHFSQACVPALHGGFFSGFLPTAPGARNDTVFRVAINSTEPIVFYCSQNTGSHCKNGMVGTINAVTGRGLEFYKSLAANASTAVSPPNVFGGVLVNNPPPANTSTSAATVTSTATATSTAAATGSSTVSPTATGTSGAGVNGAAFVGLAGVLAAAMVLA